MIKPSPRIAFKKTGRLAVLWVGRNPIGIELRLEVDSQLAWSRTLRSADEFRAELETVKADFIARGWEPLPMPPA